MSTFWTRFRAGYEGKSTVPAPVSAQVGPFVSGLLSPSAVEITPWQAWSFYKTISPFAKVVDLIADGVAALEPTVSIGGEIVEDHFVAQLLNRPGFNRTRKRLLKELAVQQLVTGTAYVHVIGNPGFTPVAMDVLKTHCIAHTPAGDGWPERFHYAEYMRNIQFSRDPNELRDFRWIDEATGLGEIIPIIDMEGDKRAIGLSRLNAIRADIELRAKGLLHNTSMLDNGARPSGVLTFKSNLTEDVRADLESQMRQMMTGYNNAGRVLVIDGSESDFNALSQNMKDMDFAKLLSIVEDAIVARYNVPVTLYRTDAQTNNNYETAWNVLYDQAILPTFNTLMSSLSAMFTLRLKQLVEIKHDPLTSPILARQATARAREMFGARLISRNEAREIAGYEPVLGGDQIFGPMGEVPQGEDLFTGIDANDRNKPARKPETTRSDTDQEVATRSAKAAILRFVNRLEAAA